MKSVYTIVGLGEILWDLYPDEKHLGGAPANAAIHAQRLGVDGIIVSAVGRDHYGDEIIQALSDQGLPTTTIQRSTTHPTGIVGVKLDERSVPTFQCSRDTAFDHIPWNDDLGKLARDAHAVIVGTLAQRNEDSRQTIQRFISETKGIVVFDVNFREWNPTISRIVCETLPHTGILKLNSNELKQMREAMYHGQSIIPFLDWLIDEYGLKLIALSMGPKGCFLTDGTARILSPGIIVDPVDTTGSGDGFVAGLILKFLQKTPLEETAEFANYLGAFLTTYKGSTPLYTIQDLEAFREKPHERIVIHL
jgi:fructokinase